MRGDYTGIALLVDGVAAALHEQRGLLCPLKILSSTRDEAKRGRLEAALKLLLDWAYGRDGYTHLPTLLLDDLHRISEKSWVSDLASIFQAAVNQHQLALVLAGREALIDVLRDDVSFLRLISQHHALEPLTLAETRALAARASEYGWTIETDCADLAYKLTNGHPYRLHYYFDAVLSNERKLTRKGLQMIHTPETVQHLDEILADQSMKKQRTRPTVFISYSHKDEKEKERLLSHLRVLAKDGLIEIWYDDRIGAGADWNAQIKEKIDEARVAILLISANFLSSDFILSKEVPPFLERRQREGLTVFPVIAKACPWKTCEWLTKMQVRPKNGQPIWSGSDSHVDEALSGIAEEVAAIAKNEN